MSNVLIGIIGVILFIGLALAGALFLGPQFQESTNNSRASASVQAVSQISSAANMYTVQEGRSDYTLANLVSGGYLKSIPANPTSSEAGFEPTLDATNAAITMNLGNNAEKVCVAIAKQTGTLATTGDLAAAMPAAPSGCFEDDDNFVAYSRI